MRGARRNATRRLLRRGLVLAGLLVVAGGLVAWWAVNRREHRHDGVIRAAALRYGVDAALVKAVVWRESRFDARARGRAGEIGLMQLTDAAAQEWAESEGVYPLPEEHLFNPRTNTLAGTWYLRKLLRRYAQADQPEVFALAEYNAGRGNVLRWAKGESATNGLAFHAGIGFPSTQAYVSAVLERRARYRAEFR